MERPTATALWRDATAERRETTCTRTARRARPGHLKFRNSPISTSIIRPVDAFDPEAFVTVVEDENLVGIAARSNPDDYVSLG